MCVSLCVHVFETLFYIVWKFSSFFTRKFVVKSFSHRPLIFSFDFTQPSYLLLNNLISSENKTMLISPVHSQ